MNTAPPKLRTDLKLLRQETAEGVWFVVKDPSTEKFFRFREAEHFIATQFDGETPPDVIRERTEATFGSAITPETFNTFIRSLDNSGLLDNENSSRRKRSSRDNDKRLRGTLMYLRYRILDPAKILDWLIHRVRFFFTPGFAAFAVSLIGFSSLVTFVNWREFTGDIPRLLTLEAIPVFIVVGFLVISAHEFAHGLTCRHFGGKVREMGFMLIYFQPALYCNVSDAWLFPERSKRLLVGFAGMFFELFLWAIAVIVWRVTEVDTAMNFAALMAMTGSGISTLANLNPLIKLDGYYMLSDYLNIPNLRRKSFRYFGDMLKSFWGIVERPGEGITKRERRIFLLYGGIATVGSISIMGVVTFEVGAYLIEQSQFLVLSFFLALVSTRFRTRVSRVFGKKSTSDEDFEDGTAPASTEASPPSNGRPQLRPAATFVKESREQTTTVRTAPQPENGKARLRPDQSAAPAAIDRLPIQSQPESSPQQSGSEPEKKKRKTSRSSGKSRRKKKRRISPILLVILITSALELLFFGWLELKITGPFNILPIQYVDVRAEVDGVIEDILVREGSRVTAGDVVARISGREHLASLQQVEASIDRSRAELQILETGPRKAEIDLARAAISRAKDRLRFEEAKVERGKQLYERDILSLTEYESMLQLHNAAENDLIEAEKRYTLLLRNVRPEQIQAAQAQLAGLEVQREKLNADLQRVEVRTPVDGVVATPARQLNELLYQRADRGSLIARISDSKRMTVEIAVSEKDIGDIKVGNAVAFKARAYPDTTFYGVVTATAQVVGLLPAQQGNAPAATNPSGTPATVLVRTEIDNSSHLLKPGMTGHAKIMCGERRIVSLILRRVAQTVKVEFWSLW